jgi:hypothetical protein
MVSNFNAPSGQRRIRAPLCCCDSVIYLSNGVLSSLSKDGCGRTQPISRGVEKVDHGKVGTVGKKKDGVDSARRAVPRRRV